jgi:hypothetical protein
LATVIVGVAAVACGFQRGHQEPGVDAPTTGDGSDLADAPGTDPDASSEPDAPVPFVCPPPATGCTLFECASKSSCYYVCDTPKLSWSAARDRCANEGMGCIVTIDDQLEQDCIVAATNPTFPTFLWFGLSQSPSGSEPDGGWSWQCPATGTYTGPGWGGGEPNDEGNEDCAALTGGGGWFDGGCGVNARYICELVSS